MPYLNFKSDAHAASAACLIAVVIAVLIASVPVHAVEPNSAAKPALTVTVARPTRSNLPLKLAANGSVAAWQEATIGAEVGGLRLQEVRVNVGDSVQQGQVLAVFAAESVQADVASARASVAEAQANAQAAIADANRAHALQSTGALSAQQISQFETTQASAQARLDSAQANLAQQNLRLQHTQVKAPDSGVISSRTASLGAVVQGGSELFKLILRNRLEWRAEVTANELERLRRGTPVTLTSAAGTSVHGVVRMVAPTIDPQSRTGLVYVDLNGYHPLRAGMFARGEFELGNSAALTVPQSAVVARDGFNYVFTVDANHKVAQRKVQVGRRVDAQVEISGGLDAQATIAVDGAGFLNDGDTVRVAP